jgi:predicted SnoaL-like aldol condensation-catalyzing enzyme
MRSWQGEETAMKRIALAVLIAASLACASTWALAGNTPQEEANKKTVIDLYEKALNQMDFEAASKHLGPRYIQHNPLAEDGAEGLKKFIEWRKQKFPNAKSVVKRAFADGDFVILHVHSVREPGERGVAIVDIFRLENGKVVEHWDVIQPIPEKAANGNGMF